MSNCIYLTSFHFIHDFQDHLLTFSTALLILPPLRVECSFCAFCSPICVVAVVVVKIVAIAIRTVVHIVHVRKEIQGGRVPRGPKVLIVS